jgi:hypothetical protein
MLVAAVCDGAGSCELSHFGARALSESVVRTLAAGAEGQSLCPDTSEDGFKSLVETAIAQARAELEATAKSAAKDLSAYASTLVGVVTWPARGHFFHVGDGYAVARPCAAEIGDIVSLPENGEYVNETYFVTGGEWRQHLRITCFEQTIATVVLMSDGAAPFAMAKGNRGLHRPFIDPVQRYLDLVTEAEGTQALAGTLASPGTDSITNDDKTLLIARRV